MQPYSFGGVILIVLGIVTMMVRSVTFFTSETVDGPAGFFAWDVDRPHTFFISPIAGVIAIAIGLALVMMSAPRERAI